MKSLNFLNGIYWATIGLCVLIGATATAFVTQITAGVALVAVWMVRVIVEAQCEPKR